MKIFLLLFQLGIGIQEKYYFDKCRTTNSNKQINYKLHFTLPGFTFQTGPNSRYRSCSIRVLFIMTRVMKPTRI